MKTTRKISTISTHHGPPMSRPSAVMSAPPTAVIPSDHACMRYDVPMSPHEVSNAPVMTRTPNAL